MHMEEKKCKSTYVKEIISAFQNLNFRQKNIFDSSFMSILFMKDSHLCFTDLLIESSSLNII